MILANLLPKSDRRLMIVGFFFAFVVSVGNGPVHAQLPVEGTNPVGWRLLWTFDPSTTATISWNTAEESKLNTVTYWKDKSKGKSVISTASDGQYTANKSFEKLFYHHAVLKNLKPGTKYHLVLQSNGKKSKPFHFYTAANKQQPFSILCGGDSRSDRKARQKMNRFIAAQLEAENILDRKDKILALAHGGDYIRDGKNLDQWKTWMSDCELMTTSNGQLLPIIPTRGNHDVGPLFNEIFNFASKHQNHYAVVINQSLAMITLNSETTMAGNQARWLDNALKFCRPKYRWVVAQYHTPAYPAYKRPGGALVHFVPLFEKYNVDLVVEADGHTIKRTVPIRGNKMNKDGIVYVGEGGLGVKPRVPKTNRWYLKEPGKTGSGHHIQKISFNKKSLVFQVILPDGTVFDKYSRKPRKK